MMKLSRTVVYALKAALQLSQVSSPMPVPCSRLAATGNMPERFLLQILRNLVTHGILRSTRGVDGGYTLARPAEQISLLDVVEAIDGRITLSLPLQEGLSPEVQGTLDHSLESVTHLVRQEFEKIKLSDLLQNVNASSDSPSGASTATTSGASATPPASS
jgi:Rrf2 family protein